MNKEFKCLICKKKTPKKNKYQKYCSWSCRCLSKQTKHKNYKKLQNLTDRQKAWENSNIVWSMQKEQEKEYE